MLTHADPSSTVSTFLEYALVNSYFCVYARTVCSDHSGFSRYVAFFSISRKKKLKLSPWQLEQGSFLDSERLKSLVTGPSFQNLHEGTACSVSCRRPWFALLLQSKQTKRKKKNLLPSFLIFWQFCVCSHTVLGLCILSFACSMKSVKCFYFHNCRQCRS